MIDGEGRCGPKFGDMYCTGNPAYAIYCNEDNGWCGNTHDHENEQMSTRYDAATYKKCLEEQSCKFTAFSS